MKKIITLISIAFYFLCFNQIALSQEDQPFVRKGKFLVESGYNIVSGLTTGTGISILSDEGFSISSIGFDGGYFTSENLALKFRLGILSADGENLVNFGLGAKYYIAGKVPIEVGLGSLSANGESTLLGNISIGYGLRLADNINLEPSIGLLAEEVGLFQASVKFAMFL